MNKIIGAVVERIDTQGVREANEFCKDLIVTIIEGEI